MKEENQTQKNDRYGGLTENERFIATRINSHDLKQLADAFEMCRVLMDTDQQEVLDRRGNTLEIIKNERNLKRALAADKEIGRQALEMLKSGRGGSEAEELFWKTILHRAPYDFDSFMRYMEIDRPMRKKFYEPRRVMLYPMTQDMQLLADGKLDLLAISCPPGVGKTTLSIFFLIFIEGQHPDRSVLGGSHSNSFLRGVYDEIVRMLDPAGEYRYRDIFPLAPLANTNAKDMRIDLAKKKRFESFEFSSIGSSNAGKVRASNLLYCDDLVDGIETAMSIERLDKLYQQYYTDLRQRKIGECRELHVATRWSVHDVIGRLEQQYAGNNKAKFIKYAALNEKDESNFDYPFGLGFSTDFYRQQRDIMDQPSWEALYMNVPIEREGLLYEAPELRRFFELPEAEPDAIIAVCDTKEQGDDYCAMPIVFKYGNDYYVEDWICDNGKPDAIQRRIIRKILDKQIQMLRIESNRGGTLFATNIQNAIKEKGSHCKITTKWNQTQKATRILVAADWVKTHCLFLDESLYPAHKEYRTAMTMLTGYSMMGRNKHDDIPDAMAMLENFARSFDMNKVEVMKRPF